MPFDKSKYDAMIKMAESVREIHVITTIQCVHQVLDLNNIPANEKLKTACYILENWLDPPQFATGALPSFETNEDGTFAQFMPRVNGKPFRCSCRCNVFKRRQGTGVLVCNVCDTEYEEDWPTASQKNFREMSEQNTRSLIRWIESGCLKPSGLTFALEELGKADLPEVEGILLKYSAHESPLVREGALEGMTYYRCSSAIESRVEYMAKADPSKCIREIAENIVEDWDDEYETEE